MHFRARATSMGLLVLCLFVLACNSGNVNAPANVFGKVTYNGAPVTGGFVYLNFEDGSKVGMVISADGSYSGESTEGTFPITVDTESINPSKKQEYRGQGAGGPAAKYGKASAGPKVAAGKGAQASPAPEGHAGAEGVYMKIPAKYADKSSSGLSVTLKKGKNEYNIALTD